MVTKEQAIAIRNGDIDWYVVVARAHAVNVHKALRSNDVGERRKSFDSWYEFLNRLPHPAKWDAYGAFCAVSSDYLKGGK
jgi:hypothetical protein